ncbi:MAG: hypothetical protein JWN45_3535 [Acidobacteriaceae bacterium]|nr:hypothetical protein [Acidobacteriaceae bacterium]
MWNRAVVFLLLSGILSWSNLGCNGVVCFSSTPVLVPSVFAISPNPVSAFDFQTGGTLIVNGTNFVPASVVVIDGVNHPTAFVNDGVLRVSVFPADMRSGTLNFVVVNPRTLGGFCGVNDGVSGVIAVSILN